MPTLHIRLLGDFCLNHDQEPVTGVNRARLQSLLAYLLLHRHAPQSRRHLAFLFWPDTNEAQALTNLRTALHRLRQALPAADLYLRTDSQSVQWQVEARFTLDVADFETVLGKAKTCGDLEGALKLYRGDLLPSCYDDWIAPERERLRQAAIRAFERLIGLLEEQRDYRAAIDQAQRLLHLDPLNEATYRRLMRLHAADNDRAAALRVYQACVTMLQNELAVEPAPQTRELYLRLSSSAAAAPVAASQRQDQPPLVGRQSEWQALRDAWFAASNGKPHCVLLTGEAGIGKTRLAEELLTWVSRQGFAAAVARCYAAEGALAFAPVIAWLRSPALHQRLRTLDALWASEAARALPELLTERRDLSPPAPLAESAQRQRLFEALARAALKPGEPLLLWMDDIQWCDRDSLEWLRYLLHFDPAARLLVIGAVRSEELADNHPLTAFLSALHRAGQLSEVTLGPLNAEETAALAAHVSERGLTPTQAAHLFHETEGNPLFVIETMRSEVEKGEQEIALADRQTSPTTLLVNSPPLPPKVHAVLHSRLAQLSPNARALIGLAATIGREFTLAVLAQASDLDEPMLVNSLDELWQRRMVRELSDRGAEVYDFTHDKLREVAYNSLSAARRRLLHRHIAQALEAVYSHALDVMSGQVAVHYELAGRFEQAVTHYARAATVARRVYANTDAIGHYRHAIALLANCESVQGAATALHEGLGDLLYLVSQHAEARTAFQQALVHLAPTDRLGHARVQCKIGKTLVAEHDLLAGDAAYRRAQSALGSEASPSEVEWWQEWLKIQQERIMLSYWRQQPDEIETLIAQTRPFIEQHGTNAQRAQFFRSLLLMELVRKRWRVSDEMIGYATSYLTAQQSVDNPSDLAWAIFTYGFCCCFYGDLDQAMQQLKTALALSERMGDISLQSRCLTYLTLIHRQRGHVVETQQSALRSLMTASAAQMPEYMAMATANQAWVAWCARDLVQTEALGCAALALWDRLPAGRNSAPFLWLALWPLIDVALHERKLLRAIEYSLCLLEPTQHLLPDALTTILEQAIQAWESGARATAQATLEQAIQLAQQMGYL